MSETEKTLASANVHNQMAQFAYQTISEGIKTGEFRSLARSFPAMLQVNGLGAAIAFLYSKKENAHKFLYNMIEVWIKDKFQCKEKELIEIITEINSVTYRFYTNEVMSLCLWIKRFAEGMIEKNEDE